MADADSTPTVPAPLQAVADAVAQADDGVPPPERTVRELIGWFGHRGRGVNVNAWISHTLASVELDTQPDFRSVPLDARVQFVVREQVVRIDLDDPTTRVSRLDTADFRSSPGELASVKPEDPLQVAITLLLLHDYSQIPVIKGRSFVKGVVSWRSIGARISQGLTVGSDTRVNDVMDTDVATVRLSDSILQAVELIVRNDFVLVVDPTRNDEVTGIVTTADLSALFRDLTGSFILLGEIENHLRALLDGLFTPTELRAAQSKGGDDGTDRDSDISLTDLTFGAYQQLIGKPAHWDRIGLQLDRNTFLDELDAVRQIRNAILHFDADRLDETSTHRLERFSHLLRRLREVRPAVA